MTEGASPLNASIIPLSLIPEWFYCPLFVTPATSEPGSTVLKNMDASLNFRHDKKRSPRSERDGLESLRGEG